MRRRALSLSVGVVVVVGMLAATAAELPTIKTPAFSDANVHPVVRAVDGDTIVVKSDHGTETVRLIGVDTPETVHPSKPVEAYGTEASRFTANLLKGERVYLVTDPQQGKADRYGRTLAYVYRYPDGLFVNAEIVRQGYGHAYTKYPFRYMEQFRQLERFAREAEKGLWAPDAGAAAATAPASQTTPPIAPAPVARAAGVSTESPAAGNDEVTVYVTRTGSKYHSDGCRYLSKSKIPMKLKDARARYSPCSACNPPK